MAEARVSLPRVTYVGGPTALLEWGGLRLLTDPTFDPAGTVYAAAAYSLRKTQDPARPAAALLPVDAVLLSHDHHWDNLDHGGRSMLAEAPRVLTTAAGAERLGHEGVAEVAARFPVRLALLFMGAACVAAVGPWHLTFTAEEGVEAARALGSAVVVPVHFEGWEHFSESRPEIARAFAAAGLAGRLRWPAPGEPTDIVTPTGGDR